LTSPWTPADQVMDAALALALPILAWRVLATEALAKAIVLFVALGLLSAIAWARLSAPDVALVEAAVGAGLTGALLMSTLTWVSTHPRAPPTSRARRASLWLLLAAGLVALAGVVLSLPATSRGLADHVAARLVPGGVSHPVTAVLLDFRAYDTLLEVFVLLVSAIAVQGQLPRVRRPSREQTALDVDVDVAGPLLPVLVRLLLPGIVLVAGYLLWRGSHAPGGAFQAGAILGGGGILLLLARTIRPPDLSSSVVRAALLAGPAVFLAIGAAPLFVGGSFLSYPPQWSGALILTIESALTVSIAVVLTMFFPSDARLDVSSAAAAASAVEQP
jgi:multisubunit Na+/H+ antiporter MnhB subunit